MRKYIERHPKGVLKEAFTAATTLEYGPFSVERLRGQNWGEGRFCIEGKHISLAPRKVQILSVLIAQQGQLVTPAMFAHVMDMEINAVTIAASDPMLKNIHVHLSQIKKQFAEHTGSDAFNHMIKPAQSRMDSVRKETRDPDLVGCYKLVIPPPAA